jgi:hypothetical protein
MISAFRFTPVETSFVVRCEKLHAAARLPQGWWRWRKRAVHLSILRLHFAQEDEIYDTLAEAA